LQARSKKIKVFIAEDRNCGTQHFKQSFSNLWRVWKKGQVRQSSIIFLPVSLLLFLSPKSTLMNRDETWKIFTTAILRNLCNKVYIHPYTICRHSDTQFTWESGVEQGIIKSSKFELRQRKTMQTAEDYIHQRVKVTRSSVIYYHVRVLRCLTVDKWVQQTM
jgi:hypothetical protein